MILKFINEKNFNNISDNGEFDPGSGRTLAAWIRHASRTRHPPLLTLLKHKEH